MKTPQERFLDNEMQRDSKVFKQCHFYKRVGFDNKADFYLTKTGITLYGEREEVEILLGNQDIKTIIRKVNITSGISNVGGQLDIIASCHTTIKEQGK